MLSLGVGLLIISSSWRARLESFWPPENVLLHSDGRLDIPTDGQSIAIIGAGIGGASAAFHLHQLNINLPEQKITTFEKGPVVGGRIQSVYLYPLIGGRKIIEDGATHFYTDDRCLMKAMQAVGLKPLEQPQWPYSQFGMRWTDDNVRRSIKCNAESTAWLDLIQRDVEMWVFLAIVPRCSSS